MKLSDLTNFDTFISPTLIKIGYWLGIIGIVVGSLGTLFSSFAYGFFSGIWGILVTLFGMAVALLFWRVLCEGLILVFKIHDRLGEVRDRLPQDNSRLP